MALVSIQTVYVDDSVDVFFSLVAGDFKQARSVVSRTDATAHPPMKDSASEGVGELSGKPQNQMRKKKPNIF